METGLEGKPWYIGLSIGLGVSLVVFSLCAFKLFDGIKNDIATVEQQIIELEQNINQGRVAEQQLPKFRAQVGQLELDLEKLLRILPTRKNTQELIRRFRSLTEQAGFKLNVFDPAERETDREFYKEWPIQMDIDGGYHELALFFDRVARFSRIINIENLKINTRRGEQGHVINASFTAKTFVYKDTPPEEPQERRTRR